MKYILAAIINALLMVAVILGRFAMLSTPWGWVDWCGSISCEALILVFTVLIWALLSDRNNP